MGKLKLVMAVSRDGFVARGTKDDMSWTGRADKEVFRLLTGVGSGVVGVGRLTAEQMPAFLEGRRIVAISSDPRLGTNLGRFSHEHPGAWLAGGQTVALEALRADLVEEVHLVRNPVKLVSGIKDLISRHLEYEWWQRGMGYKAMETKLDNSGLEIEVWRRGRR